MQSIAVLDYGMSNLRSVAKALEFVCADRYRVIVTNRAEELLAAERVVFPGQGAIGQCMANLRRLDLVEAVEGCIRGKPYLGICLGLQSLMESSEEDGGTACLGLVPGGVVRFPADSRDPAGKRCKVPHMGWNQVARRQAHALWKDIDTDARFYFVHSYFVTPRRGEDVAAVTGHGIEFVSALARENVFAVQFHPEKSQRAGLQLLRNFVAWRP
ncbi:MAG: imidazole glycerol phosphate synthase subunit HisH [Gammaproteobacteria bacterium]|nr:imidazole glycerol phosphate synthase subunit HisH [Gammaproteobacteria bacterium]